MFPIQKIFLELQSRNIFLFIYFLLIYLSPFMFGSSKVNCNKKALKILDHTYHLPLLKCFY